METTFSSSSAVSGFNSVSPQSKMCHSPDRDDVGDVLTVFEGSSPDDACHARQLWSSMALLPPHESRLMSADIGQRLPVSRPQRSGPAAAPAPDPPSVPSLRQRREERQRYEAMADQRREILALLRRQREQRVQKELISVAFKPRLKVSRERNVPSPPESEMDQDLVQQLQ